MVIPGTYYLTIISIKGENNEQIDTVYSKVPFEVKGLNNQSLLADDMNALLEFRSELSEFNRTFDYFTANFKKTQKKIDQIQAALLNESNGLIHLIGQTQEIKDLLNQISIELFGDKLKSSYEFETAPSLTERFGMLQYKVYANTSGITNTHKKDFELCSRQFEKMRDNTREIEKRILSIQKEMEEAGMPHMLD